MSLTLPKGKRFSGLRPITTLELLRDETLRLLLPDDLASLDLGIPKPQNEDELERFIAETIGLRVPKSAVRPGNKAPWQAFCDAYFARYPVCIWLGARGLAGKTFQLALLGFVEALTLRANVNILGGSADQSEKVLDYLKAFWQKPGAPNAALKDDPTSRIIQLIWGNKIKALTASQKQARGGHPHRLRLDELDEMEIGLWKAVRGQPMGTAEIPAQVVASSTHHYPNGTMTAAIREAAEKGWPIYRWGYDETLETNGGWLTQSQLSRSRITMDAETWRVEVELGEPSTEGRAIMTAKVEAMFVGTDIICEEGQEYEFEEPVAGAHYSHGADWGQTSDYSEQAVFRDDVRPIRLVAYCYMRRRAYPEMVARLDARMVRYPGDGAHDYTGVGRVGEFLKHGVVEDVTMVGRTREDLFRNYILAIENDEIRAPRVTRLFEMHKYVRNVDLYTGFHGTGSDSDIKKGHPPDGFVAMAMANKASATSPPMRLLFAKTTAQAHTADTHDAVRSFFQKHRRPEDETCSPSSSPSSPSD